ncbi:MAG: ABC transporter substrate-binding protein [Bacteroidaceae bacterium]|nr:ABC transporter substrate-binding protein [Bacteroidaceae bacterium]
MKRTLHICLLIAMVLGVFPASRSYAADREHTLKVYNWADYIDESLLDEFVIWYKEQTGEEVEIIYQLFDINEVMLAKLEKGHEDFDVVCPSEYIIDRMLANDMLLPINRDFGTTPDYTRLVSPFFVEQLAKFDQNGKQANDYAVGYMWGTTGILYNPKYITDEEADSWGIIWDNRLDSKVLMKDAYRDIYGCMIMYARYQEILEGKVTRQQLMNDTSDEAIDTVEVLLKSAKQNIAGWEVDFGKEMMTKEKAYINVSWSGDAVWAIEEAAAIGMELRYHVPREGSNVWFDGWVIPKYAVNTKAAAYFINFMCMPENALRNMDEIGYVSVVASPEILEAKIDSTLEEYSDLTYFFGEGADSVPVDNIQYPDRTVIERAALMRDCGNRTKSMIEMWSRVKGDSLAPWVYIVIGVTFGGGLVWYIYIKVQERKRWAKYRKNKKKNQRKDKRK